jgi:hypothetical protein
LVLLNLLAKWYQAQEGVGIVQKSSSATTVDFWVEFDVGAGSLFSIPLHSLLGKKHRNEFVKGKCLGRYFPAEELLPL